MILQVGMAALLDKADQMASMDWRVVPVPWRESLASPGRPLKVSMHVESESKSSSFHLLAKKLSKLKPGRFLHRGWHLPAHPRHGQGRGGGGAVASEGRPSGSAETGVEFGNNIIMNLRFEN